MPHSLHPFTTTATTTSTTTTSLTITTASTAHQFVVDEDQKNCVLPIFFYPCNLKQKNLYPVEMLEFVDNEVLVLHFDTLMYDLQKAVELFDSSLRSTVRFTAEKYKELTELIDELHKRALLLRRQFTYFNLNLYKCIVRNGAEYETLHSFFRPLSRAIVQLEEYRKTIDHRYYKRGGYR
nr:hypothetical transcript [Hymenolepis microstoma]